MSQASEVEAKIAEELRSMDLLATPENPKPRVIQFDDIFKMTYINAVIKVSPFVHLQASLGTPSRLPPITQEFRSQSCVGQGQFSDDLITRMQASGYHQRSAVAHNLCAQESLKLQ